jgi:oxepin-CoA hydrolase/3-oxo-5,6-dehydrosuberyl-CoA semialdehyde dehydrogenase
VPDGAISLICGGAGDLLDQLDSQDVVTFTGSASRAKPARAPEYCGEFDSVHHGGRLPELLRAGEDVTPEQPEFALFIREVVREMTAKAGQKCTAIRRIIVRKARLMP